MKRYQSISFIAGILAVLCYLVFAILAFIRYPLPYSPIRNWLSDLGNVDLNPHGAIYYNIGIISTALLVSVFVLEWITLLLFLSYVSLVGVETRRLESGRHTI